MFEKSKKGKILYKKFIHFPKLKPSFVKKISINKIDEICHHNKKKEKKIYFSIDSSENSNNKKGSNIIKKYYK